jgi:hypothetical protein
MARISIDVFVPALTKIQLQRCLRHRLDGISVVSDVSDAVLVPSQTPLIWHQRRSVLDTDDALM